MKMRLLLAIKSLNVQGGGAERVLVDVANGLCSRGHNVQVLTFDEPGDSFYALDPRVARLDMCIGQPGQPIPRSGLFKAIPRLRRLIQTAHPDLVMGFMHSMYVPLAISLVGTRMPLVASEHIDAAHYRTRPIQKALVRIVDKLALAKTVPSAPLRDEHKVAYRGRIQVLPNPVALGSFSIAIGKEPEHPPVIVSIGRLMEQKQHLDLIRAFTKIASDFDDWLLRIVGEGHLRPLLEAEVAKLKMENRIQLPGVSRDVVQEYASATFVALPSMYESFGLVAAEALAAGRPVLAFRDCLGIAEMIESGRNGLLVESKPDRVSNLADGLERLMSNRALRARLAAAGPDSVRRFATEHVIDTWESFLLSLTRKNH